MDALVMERLTASPLIPNVFSHCGTSVRTEYLPEEISPYMDGAQAPEHFTPVQKLQHALTMAEALATLHGFRDGVIVHNDLSPYQFISSLTRTDGTTDLKLNDFNMARPLSFDDENGVYCRHRDGHGRSPEEANRQPIDEKAEIWELGNLVYGLLTGKPPFYHVKSWTIVARVAKGEQAKVDERYRTGSVAEGRMVEVLERCWVYELKERADVFEVVGLLRDALEESLR